MSNREDFIEVPPPMYKYDGVGNIHDDNQAVLRGQRERSRARLSKRRYQAVKKELKAIRQELRAADAARYLAAYDTLLQDYNSARLRFEALRTAYESAEDDSTREPLMATGRQIRHEMRIQSIQLTKLHQHLEPLRPQITRQNRLERMIRAHRFAIEEDRNEAILLQRMQKEAARIGTSLQKELARLNFRYVESKGNKTITHHVKFSHVVTTPDQHQFKIATYSTGIAGGVVSHLPQGVDLTELLKPNVMANLSAAIERQVWSPHIDEDVNHVNGAWIVVERMGLYEGIPKKVTYRQIMARYETAEHERIPLPAGLRKGRRINWTYLDSHASTHIMFTGITGSGKTNAIQSNISAVIETQSPRDVLFVIIDLKNQGDFTDLAHAPHMLRYDDETTVITQIPDVVTVLQRVRAEMHWRQSRIGTVAKNISSYNRRVREEDRLPRIVVLFDEYANTRRARFADEAAAIDDICTEITQLGRASGIHLWLGIQQPRRDNIPPALKDNFTTTFVGHQASVGAGQSVTGNRASLKLPDLPGRMMAYRGWKSYEVQMPLISDDDIIDAVKAANEQYGHLAQYPLHYDESTLNEAPRTEQDIILESAMESFGGWLKKRAIWEHLKPTFSQREVFSAIDAIIESGTVEYEGITYVPEKQQNQSYLLKVASQDAS